MSYASRGIGLWRTATRCFVGTVAGIRGWVNGCSHTAMWPSIRLPPKLMPLLRGMMAVLSMAMTVKRRRSLPMLGREAGTNHGRQLKGQHCGCPEGQEIGAATVHVIFAYGRKLMTDYSPPRRRGQGNIQH